jgi:hypothetical protein
VNDFAQTEPAGYSEFDRNQEFAKETQVSGDKLAEFLSKVTDRYVHAFVNF